MKVFWRKAFWIKALWAKFQSTLDESAVDENAFEESALDYNRAIEELAVARKQNTALKIILAVYVFVQMLLM